jgi:hypothetical protein
MRALSLCAILKEEGLTLSTVCNNITVSFLRGSCENEQRIYGSGSQLGAVSLFA